MTVSERRTWTDEEIAEIIERYPNERLSDLADEFNVTTVKLSGIAHYYGVKQNEREGRPWKIRKVESEVSQLNVLSLMESQYMIGQKLLSEKDFETAKKLEAIYKSMNEAINKSL